MPFRWTVSLDGGPRRVNHASVVIDGYIYMFGGYCMGEHNYDDTQPIDIHVLNTRKSVSYNIFGHVQMKYNLYFKINLPVVRSHRYYIDRLCGASCIFPCLIWVGGGHGRCIPLDIFTL